MYICICHSITDKTLKNTIKTNNISKIKDLYKLDVCNNCKKCAKEIKRILNEQNIHERNSI